MEDKNVDRRIRKTKSQLKKALNELMETKTIREISVKELTAHADVNRGTFYLHYENIFDMVDKLEQEMFEEFNEFLNEKHNNDDISPLHVLVDVFKFLADNSQMCISLLGHNGDAAFAERLNNLIRERCLKEWMSHYSESSVHNFNYYYSFVSAGCSGLFRQWLHDGMKETPEQMSALAGKMILYGVKVLE